MSERTKGPWRNSCFQIYGADNSRIANTGMGNLPPSRSSESEANAAAIVLWENNFDALVRALDESRLQIEYMQSKFEPTGSGNAVLASIRSVLAKVKP